MRRLAAAIQTRAPPRAHPPPPPPSAQHVRLAQNSQPETPEALRLSEEQQAELRQQVERTTLRLLWQLTQRDVEDTARRAVVELLQEPGLEPRRRQARADALLLVGGVFGRARGFEQTINGGPAPVGERVRGSTDYALDRLNQATDAADKQLVPHLQVAAVQAGESFSGLMDSVFGTTSRTSTSNGTRAMAPVAADQAPPPPPPPPPPEGFVGLYIKPDTPSIEAELSLSSGPATPSAATTPSADATPFKKEGDHV